MITNLNAYLLDKQLRNSINLAQMSKKASITRKTNEEPRLQRINFDQNPCISKNMFNDQSSSNSDGRTEFASKVESHLSVRKIILGKQFLKSEQTRDQVRLQRTNRSSWPR
ncbi:hypothetical protein FGO68_gene13060 [Halteria grandinella]|uniref:Uncharacterized protein n=1 Tax=Halteria grandinella TaxID=5974 RepID=A0A8J8NAZ3_HALGN|nr:hypothetical protein FGO68_gene13060 [Halteria grandinella]